MRQGDSFKPLTEQELDIVMASLAESYRVFHPDSIRSHLEPYILEGGEKKSHVRGNAAEFVRNTLWDTYAGGGMSAKATRTAFKAIGRENECDPRWI